MQGWGSKCSKYRWCNRRREHSVWMNLKRKWSAYAMESCLTIPLDLINIRFGFMSYSWFYFQNLCIFKDGESHICFFLLLNYVIVMLNPFIYTFIQTGSVLKLDLVKSPVPKSRWHLLHLISEMNLNGIFAVADLSGARGTSAPPPGPNSFNFMQFLEKFGKIVCWRPPGELAPPPRGNPGSATALAITSKIFEYFNSLIWKHLLEENYFNFAEVMETAPGPYFWWTTAQLQIHTVKETTKLTVKCFQLMKNLYCRWLKVSIDLLIINIFVI